MANGPSRFETNAILLPSGEKSGPESERLEAMNLVGGFAESERETFHMRDRSHINIGYKSFPFMGLACDKDLPTMRRRAH
jgi:hypothetical protein